MLPFMSRIPPEAFQFVTFISDNNKDAEYMRVLYKNMLKCFFNSLEFVSNLRK